MTPSEFYQKLMSAKGPSTLKIGMTTSELPVKVNANDGRAAELLLFAEEHWPDITMGDLQDAILTAHWWLVFWSSVAYGPDAPSDAQTTVSESGGENGH